MKKKICVGIGLVLFFVFGIAVMRERHVIAEKSPSLNVIWDGIEYEGIYEGDLKNAVPEGHGTFVSDDKEITYEGDWKKGKFSGKGTIIYGNNVKESGIFLKGKRNGEFRKQLSDSKYEITNYKNDVPYGMLCKYDNNQLESKDYYYGGKLVSSILKNAKEMRLSEIVRDETDELICFEATVLKISQLENSCILLLSNKDGNSCMVEYNNTEIKKNSQAYVPNVQEGANIEVFGYYAGEEIYAVANDSQYYGGVYPKIKPVWVNIIDKTLEISDKVTEYSSILENPYLYIGESRQLELVVDDVIYSDSNGKYYCKTHSVQSEAEIYYIKLTEEELPLRGVTLSISGKVNGQYKELQNKEEYLKYKEYQNEIKEPIREMNKKIVNEKEQSTNDIEISYEYKIYPLLIEEE